MRTSRSMRRTRSLLVQRLQYRTMSLHQNSWKSRKIRQRFKTLYNTSLQHYFLVDGREGPLNIYDPRYVVLLLKCAGHIGVSLDCDRVSSISCDGADYLCKVWEMSKWLLHMHDRYRAHSSLNEYFHQRSMPYPRGIVFTVTHASWRP